MCLLRSHKIIRSPNESSSDLELVETRRGFTVIADSVGKHFAGFDQRGNRGRDGEGSNYGLAMTGSEGDE